MKKISASVAGRVTASHVQEGSAVVPGEDTFVIESMKMEIPVESEHAGRVNRILVAIGDEVEEGQVLAELE